MEKLTLSKPFKLENGNEIRELQLNFEDLSVADLRQVSKLEGMIAAQSSSVADMATPKKLSFNFHLASGFLAAIKGTDGLSVGDFTRLPMTDAMTLAQAASFFWLGVE